MVELETSMVCDTGPGGVKNGQGLRVGPTRWFIPYDGTPPVRLTPPPPPERDWDGPGFPKNIFWQGLGVLVAITLMFDAIFGAVLLGYWGSMGPALKDVPAWVSNATHQMAQITAIVLGFCALIGGIAAAGWIWGVFDDD